MSGGKLPDFEILPRFDTRGQKNIITLFGHISCLLIVSLFDELPKIIRPDSQAAAIEL